MLYSFTGRKRKYLSGASKVKNKKMREHERSLLLNPIANLFSKIEYPATHNNMAEPDNPAAIQSDIEEPPNPAALQPDIAEPDNLDFSEFRKRKNMRGIFKQLGSISFHGLS